MKFPPLNLFNYNLFYRWVNEMDIWKAVPNKPGLEVNQKGQFRNVPVGVQPTKYKEPAYKPFTGDEWPDHDFDKRVFDQIDNGRHK